jgi:hypothetical protein
MKVRYTKIIFDQNFKRFRGIEENDILLSILRSFLTSDVGCYWPSFRIWIDNDNEQETGGNTTILNKDGMDIILSDLFSEQEDGGPFLRMHRDELARILDEWKGFCQTKPKEVLITYNEHGKVILTPTY